MFRSNLDKKSTGLQSNLSEEHQKIIDNFIKEISEKAMERVNKILHTEEENIKTDLNSRNTTNGPQNLIDEIANTLTNNIIANLNLTGIDPINVVSDSLVDPNTKYYNCPPLGSPIIVNRILVIYHFLYIY